MNHLPRRFVGAMSGPRGGWPMASLEIYPSGEVVLEGQAWKFRPPPVRWLQGTVERAEHIRGAVTGREGRQASRTLRHAGDVLVP
jgi:hypothetical protein